METKVLAIIAKLEAQADGTDAKLASDLAGRREQLGLLRGSIRRAAEEIGPQFLQATQGVVYRAHRAIHTVVKGMALAHAAEVAAPLVPFCESPEHAVLIVQQTVPSYRYVLGNTSESLSLPNDLASVLAHSGEQLRQIEALLSGGDVFPDFVSPLAAREAAAAARTVNPAQEANAAALEAFSQRTLASL